MRIVRGGIGVDQVFSQSCLKRTLPQGHSSGDPTEPLATGFASTYYLAVTKCPSFRTLPCPVVKVSQPAAMPLKQIRNADPLIHPDTLDHSVIELAQQSQLHAGHLRRVGNAEKVGEHTCLGPRLELRLATTSRVVTVVHSVGIRRPDRDLAVRGLA